MKKILMTSLLAGSLLAPVASYAAAHHKHKEDAAPVATTAEHKETHKLRLVTKDHADAAAKKEEKKAPGTQIHKSRRLEAMKAAAHIRDNQMKAWDAYADAYRKFRHSTDQIAQSKAASIYGERMAQNAIARASSARELLSAVSSLRHVLDARQIAILENFKPLHKKK